MTDTRVDVYDPAVDDGWGPPVRGRGRGRTSRTVARLLALVLLAPLVAAVAVWLYASSQIERVPVTNLAGGVFASPMHILVVGSDSREELTRRERAELNTGFEPGNRTDTIFIMTVSGGDAALLALPRDLLVTRCDGTRGRINAAVGIDGPGCLVETVRDLSGIPIHHYLAVSFGGFRDIVDAVGGVGLCLEQPIADRDAGIDLPAGCQVLQGPDALGYVRVRKIDNDLERIQRQQQFLRALADEVLSRETLLRPVRLFDTAGQIGQALTADEGLGPIDLARVGLGLRGLATGMATTYTLPTVASTAEDAAVLEPVEGEAEALFARFRDGSILDEDPAALEPGDVDVAVLNGAGVQGLAGGMAAELEARGYTVVTVGNAPATPTTVLRYPPGQREAAQLIAGELPVAVALEESTAVATVTLILGGDAAAAAG